MLALPLQRHRLRLPNQAKNRVNKNELRDCVNEIELLTMASLNLYR